MIWKFCAMVQLLVSSASNYNCCHNCNSVILLLTVLLYVHFNMIINMTEYFNNLSLEAAADFK